MEIVGGQAVLEGVMMKSGSKIATAVRDSKGKIKVEISKKVSLTKKYKHLNIPIIRGLIILFETLIIGLKALNFSANIAIEEENKKEKLSNFSIALMIIFSVIFALILFKLIPLGIAQFIANLKPDFENRYLFNLLEGITKIIILILYIYIISLMPDIKRVFQYHGAEHKVVNAYENNDLKNAKKYSRIHLRCGTSFILFVLFISIFVYMFIPMDLPFLTKYAIRILLLPLIAGLGYELIRLAPKYQKNILFKIIMFPGLLLQRMTTKEPDEDQIEVAKHALKHAT